MKIIKTIKFSALITMALVVMPLLSGCALLLLAGVGAGAAYGTVKYVNNTLEINQSVSLDRAWDAANDTLKDLQMPVTTTTKDGANGRLEARNANNQPVVIKLIRKSNTDTDIQITVGTFESGENKTEAQQIFDKMKARF